jgi:hypothetical protein
MRQGRRCQLGVHLGVRGCGMAGNRDRDPWQRRVVSRLKDRSCRSNRRRSRVRAWARAAVPAGQAVLRSAHPGGSACCWGWCAAGATQRAQPGQRGAEPGQRVQCGRLPSGCLCHATADCEHVPAACTCTCTCWDITGHRRGVGVTGGVTHARPGQVQRVHASFAQLNQEGHATRPYMHIYTPQPTDW